MKTVKERFVAALQLPVKETLAFYKSSFRGLTEDQVEENRDLYGENIITKGQEDSILKKIYESIINPFTVILLVIALVSLVTNVWLAKPGEVRAQPYPEPKPLPPGCDPQHAHHIRPNSKTAHCAPAHSLNPASCTAAQPALLRGWRNG